jgi:hypothetical protein
MIPMVDVTHDSVQRIPADLKIKIGLYITGSEDIEATLADRDRFADAAGVVLIDQSDSLDADLGDVKVVKDTEAGASKIPTTVNVVAQRHAAGKGTSPYIATGDLAALLDALRAAGELGPWVTIWEADWNLSEAEATARLGTDLGNGAIIASIQFASPTSNPDTLIPGTSIALAQANADLSVTLDAWMAKAAPAPKPEPKPSGTARVEVSVDLATGKIVGLHSLPGSRVHFDGPENWLDVRLQIQRGTTHGGQWRATP